MLLYWIVSFSVVLHLSLVDYYDIYYQDLWEPYSNWRRYRHEEVATLRKLERQALTRQILGVTAIVGAIAGLATLFALFHWSTQ